MISPVIAVDANLNLFVPLIGSTNHHKNIYPYLYGSGVGLVA
jgi:hypothetical protein